MALYPVSIEFAVSTVISVRAGIIVAPVESKTDIALKLSSTNISFAFPLLLFLNVMVYVIYCPGSYLFGSTLFVFWRLYLNGSVISPLLLISPMASFLTTPSITY